MSTMIRFTDDVGFATLSNGKPAPADRFSQWVPMSRPVGQSARRQSDGALSMFRFREEYGVTCELRGIPASLANDQLAIADRLSLWLQRGGTCAVYTGDRRNRQYPTCGLLVEHLPTLTLSDPVNLEYTLTLGLLNLAASPGPMRCEYATGHGVVCVGYLPGETAVVATRASTAVSLSPRD